MRVLLLCIACLAAATAAETGSAWTWPTGGPVLKEFKLGDDPYAGGQHRGIDVAAVDGEDVLAPAGGRIAFAGSVPGGGRTVTIATPDGLSVTLVHLGAYTVHRDDAVAEGAVVGRAAQTPDGEWPQPYVHLGVRRTDDPHGYLDPLTLLPPRGGVAAQPAPEPPAVEAPAPAPAPSPAPVAGEPEAPATQTPAPAPAVPMPVAVPAEPTPVPGPAVPVAAAPPASLEAEHGPAPAEPVVRPAPADTPAPVPSPRAAPQRPKAAPAVSSAPRTPPAVIAAPAEQPAPSPEQPTLPAAVPDPVPRQVPTATGAGLSAPPETAPAEAPTTGEEMAAVAVVVPPGVLVADGEPPASAAVEPSIDTTAVTVSAVRRAEAGATAARRTRRSAGERFARRPGAFVVHVRAVAGAGSPSVRGRRGVRIRRALVSQSPSAVPRPAASAPASPGIRVPAAAPLTHGRRGSAWALLLGVVAGACVLLALLAVAVRGRRRMPVAVAAEAAGDPVHRRSVRRASPCAAHPTRAARHQPCERRVGADPLAELLRRPRPRPAPTPAFRGRRGRSLGRLHATRGAMRKLAA